jgi:SAM-dependent methyltransferase
MNWKKYIYLLLGTNNYWETRYKFGGGSGYTEKDFKDNYTGYVWSLIDKYTGKQTDVLDVGCGDLIFWNGRDCEKYTGIDISSTIVEKDRKLRPKWKFITSSASAGLDLNAETVICMNTLYHIINDDDYEKIINNLIKWSKKYLMVLTWRVRPKNIKENDFYEKYREFAPYKQRILDSGFTQIAEENIPFDELGCLWVFKRNN